MKLLLFIEVSISAILNVCEHIGMERGNHHISVILDYVAEAFLPP